MARKPFQHSPKKFEVGYGRPPKASRWKSGQSGNPSGKKKGTKNSVTILHQIMQKKITIWEDGKRRKITVHEGLYLNYVAPGLKGDLKAADFLLGAYAEAQSAEATREANRVVRIPNDINAQEASRAYKAVMDGAEIEKEDEDEEFED